MGDHMTTLQRRAGWSAVVFLPALILATLLLKWVPDPLIGAPRSHFYVVTITAALLAVLALLMALASTQVRDIRAFFLAVAFMSISGIFLTHALTTPTAMIPYNNPWVGFSAYFSLFLGGCFLALSTLNWPAAIEKRIVNWQHFLFAGIFALLVLYNLVAVRTAATPPAPSPTRAAAPAAIADYGEYGDAPVHAAHTATAGPIMAGSPFIFLSDQRLRQLVTAVTLAILSLTIWRYTRRIRLSHSPLVTGLLVATIFLAQAQVIMLITETWHTSWWEYHVLMLTAFGAAAIGLGREYARSGSLAGVVEGLLLRDTIRQLEHGYTEVIVALVAAVEAKDPYTRGHSQRVAELAVWIGQELRLSPESLRTLNQAAILHDVGKIGVPDAILQKPGALTDEEFAMIKEHPTRGYEIIKAIRSLRRELSGVRWHHERLDGSGYPDGLRGGEIPLDARIIAVADFYDALTSRRSYREAASPAEAMALMETQAGSKLDPRCIASLRRALERSGTATSEPVHGSTPLAALVRPFDPDTEQWIPAAD
jgi:HD-GYP domain-containing protein (c-di-GMP phosphodiesterase class II)